jgi:hypothetical protein
MNLRVQGDFLNFIVGAHCAQDRALAYIPELLGTCRQRNQPVQGRKMPGGNEGEKIN